MTQAGEKTSRQPQPLSRLRSGGYQGQCVTFQSSDRPTHQPKSSRGFIIQVTNTIPCLFATATSDGALGNPTHFVKVSAYLQMQDNSSPSRSHQPGPLEVGWMSEAHQSIIATGTHRPQRKGVLGINNQRAPSPGFLGIY